MAKIITICASEPVCICGSKSWRRFGRVERRFERPRMRLKCSACGEDAVVYGRPASRVYVEVG
jgi:hypothetical protein